MQSQPLEKKRKLTRKGRRRTSSLRRKSQQTTMAEAPESTFDNFESHSVESPLPPPEPTVSTTEDFLSEPKVSTTDDFLNEDFLDELPSLSPEASPAKAEPVQEDVFDLIELVNELPLRSFALPVVNQDEKEAINQQMKAQSKALMKVNFNESVNELLNFDKNLSHYKAMLNKHPILAKVDFKKEALFLKRMGQSITDMCKLIQNVDFDNLTDNEAEVIREFKLNLNYYYSQYQPLLSFLDQLDLVDSKSIWATLMRLIHFWRSREEDRIAFDKFRDALIENHYGHLRDFANIQYLLVEMNQILFGKEIYQHIIGEVSSNIYFDDQLPTIAISLIDTVPLQGITQAFEHFYHEAAASGRLSMLKLLVALLDQDINLHLFDCDGESMIFNELLIKLDQWISSPEEEQLLESICEKIELKKEKTLEKHHQYLINIKEEKISAKDLVNKFTRMKQDYDNHIVTQRHCVIMAFDTLQNLPEGMLSQKEHQSLIEQIVAIIQSISIIDHMRLRQMFEQVMADTVHHQIYELPEWARPEFSADALIRPMKTQEKSLNLIFERIANNQLDEQSLKSFKIKFCKMVRDHAKLIFRRINISQLKKAVMADEFKYLTASDSLNEAFPNINELLNFDKQVRHFITDVAIFSYDGTMKSVRKDYNQMLNILNFFQSAADYAYKKGYYHVLGLIQQGLSHPAFHHMFKALDSKYYLATTIPIERLEPHQLPSFMRIVNRLEHLHENCSGSFLFLVLGKLIEKLYEKQNIFKEETIKSSAIATMIKKRLAIEPGKGNPSMKEEQLCTEAREIMYVEAAQAMVVSRNLLKEMDFQALAKLTDSAAKYQAPLMIQESPDKPVGRSTPKHFIDSLNKKLNKQDNLPSLRLILSIYANLAVNQNMADKTVIIAEASKTALQWINRIKSLMSPPRLSQDQIMIIRDDIYQGKNIIPKILQELPDHENLEKTLDEVRDKAQMISGLEEDMSYNQAYLKTLASYLEGKQQDQIILPSKYDKESVDTKSPMLMLQDIEEETNPYDIGFAETWNIFKQISQNLVQGPPFSFENLRDTFMKAFPWALEDPSRIGQQPIVDNLLHVNPNVAIAIQQTVMELVFISLDTIGKLAGPYGEFVLYNLEKIDHIITGLSTVTKVLDSPETLITDANAEDFLNLLDAKIQTIKDQNQMVYDKLTHTITLRDDEHFAANPAVYDLLNYNEKEVHYHIKEQEPEFDDPSILPPPIDEVAIQRQLEAQAAQAMSTEAQESSVDEWEALANEVSAFFDEDIFMDESQGDTDGGEDLITLT